jgi:hypothetical protein
MTTTMMTVTTGKDVAADRLIDHTVGGDDLIVVTGVAVVREDGDRHEVHPVIGIAVIADISDPVPETASDGIAVAAVKDTDASHRKKYQSIQWSVRFTGEKFRRSSNSDALWELRDCVRDVRDWSMSLS